MARAPLTRERIVQAALEMIDRDGVDGLSMRKLGAALGVEGMALYRHVASKERVLDGVAEVLLAELELPDAGSASWLEACHALARSYRQIAHRHRGAFRLLALSPLTTARRFERAQAPLAILRAAGFSETAAQRAFRTLLGYADGYLLRELTDRDAELDAKEADAAFEFGLRAVLTGLDHELATV
jgi:AcrR family transcriptional regulator